MWIQSLSQEDPLKEEMVTHSRILAWRIPWTEEPSGLPPLRSHRVRRKWSNLTHTHIQPFLIPDLLVWGSPFWFTHSPGLYTDFSGWSLTCIHTTSLGLLVPSSWTMCRSSPDNISRSSNVYNLNWMNFKYTLTQNLKINDNPPY